MKKCILYGNCQADEIAKILSAHKEFSEQYEVAYVCNHDPAIRGIVLPTAAFAEADVLIYQPLRGISVMTKKDCIALTFPYIYNAGVFAMYEEDDYVHGAYQIRKMKWQGVPGDYVVDMARNWKLFFDLRYRFDESLWKLFQREQSCNIKVSHIIVDNYKKQRVFFTQNHVSNLVLFEAVNGILDSLGFDVIPPDEWGEERMSANPWPVSQYEVSELGYEYPASESWLAYIEHCIRRIYAGQEK